MSKLKPKKQYTIQTTFYSGRNVVKDVTVYYPTEWINRHKLWQVIFNMTSTQK
jgi:hypothetical protein